MIISLEPSSATPPYAQIQEQMSTMVRSGVLEEGARLPAIRHLAHDLGVATGTVARAYRELEAEGLVEARGRHGTRVCDSRAAVDPARRRELDQAASSFALAAAHRGLDLDQALDVVRAAFGRLPHGGGVS